MSSVIRIGTVSKVNYEDGTIEVAYEDRDGSVTDEICVVSNALYRMPVVGAMVCVLHNSDSQEMGTCIGTFWNTGKCFFRSCWFRQRGQNGELSGRTLSNAFRRLAESDC